MDRILKLQQSVERGRRRLSEMRGAGDAVALVAQPIAKAIDKYLGTDIQNCKGCHQRQDALNESIPFHHK